MNLSNLAAAQEEMRERWADRRRNPVTRKLASADTVEALEIKQAAEKTDLVCRYCKNNKTEANKRTGEIRPCKTCRAKESYLKSKHPGMSLRKYCNLVSAQNGRCAVCTAERGYDLVVDRCSAVGHVRGLLCYECSKVIRQARESESILRNALNYLSNNVLRSGWCATSVEPA